jgi:macrolide-specific efflux system membrane fusion protein
MAISNTSPQPALRKWVLASCVIGLSIAGIFLFQTMHSKKKEAHPRRGSVIEAVYGLGTVLATRTFVLRTGVTTEVRKFYVKAGDSVKKGAPLVRLGEQGVVNAPFDGTVTQVTYKEGEIVFAQVPILKIEDLSDLYVQVSLEQQGALRVHKGLKASLVFESLRGKRFEGTVRSVFPSEGQFLTDIQVDKLPPEILPGMTTDVAIEIARKENVLMIPASSIAAGRIVVRRAQGKKEKIPVEIGVVDGEWAELISPALVLEDTVFIKGTEQ